MKRILIRKAVVTEILSLLIALVLPILFSETAQAAGFQETSVRLDRLKAATPTGGTICAKTAVADVTESNVVVTFPAGFVLSTTLTDWAVSTSNLPSGSTGWLGVAQATAADNTAKTVTFPSSNLSTNTLYCFNFTSTAALTTGSAGNDKAGTVASGGNSSTYALSLVSSPDDQISVTATVPATFTFGLSANSDTFASPLSTTAQLSNGVTVSVATNAASGWVVWVKSANAALNSTSTGATIATTGSVDNTVTTLTGGTNGYLLDATFTDSGTGTGTVTQAANYGQEYDGNSSNSGGTLSTSFQPVAASSGTTDGDTVVIKELARISAIQAAATDYADTLTVVAAGRF